VAEREMGVARTNFFGGPMIAAPFYTRSSKEDLQKRGRKKILAPTVISCILPMEDHRKEYPYVQLYWRCPHKDGGGKLVNPENFLSTEEKGDTVRKGPTVLEEDGVSGGRWDAGSLNLGPQVNKGV